MCCFFFGPFLEDLWSDVSEGNKSRIEVRHAGFSGGAAALPQTGWVRKPGEEPVTSETVRLGWLGVGPVGEGRSSFGP